MFLRFVGAWLISYLNYYVKSLPSPIVKMLIEFLVSSRYTFGLGPAISKDSLCLLNHLQNRAVHLVVDCRSMKVSQCWARLGWLLIDLYDVLAMFYQHYLSDGILFNPPIEFGNKHSNITTQLSWFATIPCYKKCFLASVFFFSDTRQLHGRTRDVISLCDNLQTHLLDMI